MSIELEYEHSNKEVLEKCCRVINKTVAVKVFKKTKLKTRRRIDAILDKRVLLETIEFT